MDSSQNISERTAALRDLIKTNNDRTVGYQKAIKNTEDADLKSVFQRMAEQSTSNCSELENQIGFMGDKTVEDNTTLSGKFYHAWMDVKSVFSGNSRHSILSDCEYGEDTALKAYNEVLDEKSLDWTISSEVIQLIQKQRAGIMKAHNEIKALRDSSANL